MAAQLTISRGNRLSHPPRRTLQGEFLTEGIASFGQTNLKTGDTFCLGREGHAYFCVYGVGGEPVSRKLFAPITVDGRWWVITEGFAVIYQYYNAIPQDARAYFGADEYPICWFNPAELGLEIK